MSAFIALLLLLSCVQIQAEIPPTLKFLSNFTYHQQPILPPILRYFSNLTNHQQAVGTRQREIAFEVLLRKDQKYSDNEVFKFDDVVCNKGGAYHRGSGIFIVPVTGAYLVWAHIERADAYAMAVNIHSNVNGVLLRGNAPRYYYYSTNAVASITGLLHLKKGEHIWFSKTAGRKTPLKGNLFSSYGGSLIATH